MVKHTHIQWRDSHTTSDWAEEKFQQCKGKSLLLTAATLFQTFMPCHLLSGYGIIWEPVCNGKWYRVLDRGPVIINNVNTSKGMRMPCRVKRIRIFIQLYCWTISTTSVLPTGLSIILYFHKRLAMKCDWNCLFTKCFAIKNF